MGCLLDDCRDSKNPFPLLFGYFNRWLPEEGPKLRALSPKFASPRHPQQVQEEAVDAAPSLSEGDAAGGEAILGHDAAETSSEVSTAASSPTVKFQTWLRTIMRHLPEYGQMASQENRLQHGHQASQASAGSSSADRVLPGQLVRPVMNSARDVLANQWMKSRSTTITARNAGIPAEVCDSFVRITS